MSAKEVQKKLSRYYHKLDDYEEYKAKVFVIIKGQCSLTMKNRMESVKGYSKMESDDDVVSLLKCLKDLAFATINVQYEYWTISQMLRSVMTMRQQENEGLASFYKRFTNTVKVTESQWGLLVPTRVASGGTNEAECRDKFLVCVFLAGVCKNKYGKLINELNNAYLAGQENYPGSVESAMTMLSHYRSGDTRTKNNTDEESPELSFAQARKNVTCYKCGKNRYYASECAEMKKDSAKEAVPKKTFSGAQDECRVLK